MIYAQSLRQQIMLRQYHVVIVVLGEMRMQAIARLARLSVANVVGENHEVTACIQKLAGPK
jgi:hypothetical protein